jgi:hypothetical protein
MRAADDRRDPRDRAPFPESLRAALQTCIALAEKHSRDDEAQTQRVMRRVLALLWSALDELAGLP